MGGGISAEQELRFVSELYQIAQSSQMIPDISIDTSLLKFSGLDSASVLDGYTSQMVNDVASKGPGFVKDLGSVLSAFKYIPNGVGLGALIISFILDLTVSGLTKTERGGDMLGMMRRVFAEEKASGVRDSMDEYMKRFRMYMHKPDELLDNTKRMEVQLSGALTRLRNSMLKDNQMSSRSMKHWTNGAAFHLQMLIHVARMEMAKRSKSNAELDKQVLSVSNLAVQYEKDLQTLLENYETYKRSTIYTDFTDIQCDALGCIHIDCGVHDTELQLKVGGNDDNMQIDSAVCRSMKDAYLNYMFNYWSQPNKLREYFSGIKQNIKKAIMQHSAFTIQKFLRQ